MTIFVVNISVLHTKRESTVKFLPPYSPGLKPAERFFLEIRKALANKVFNDLDEEITLIKNEIEKMGKLSI